MLYGSWPCGLYFQCPGANRSRQEDVGFLLFLDLQVEVDNIPYQVLGVPLHLGLEVSSGRYCTAIMDGGTWSSSQRFHWWSGELLSEVDSLHSPRSAEKVTPSEEEPPILADLDTVWDITYAQTNYGNWFGQWMPGLDILDTNMFVDNS